MKDQRHVLDRVRRALGRGGQQPAAEGFSAPPTPPVLTDSVVRLVGSDAKLPDLFALRAKELKMAVQTVTANDAAEQLLRFLKQHPIKKIVLSISPLLDRLNLRQALQAAGFEVASWDEITLDQMYDFDCGITDVSYAVAESGTLVIKPTARQGRSISLVPMYHIAFVERTQFLPDMVDLFDCLSRDPDRSNFILISGPSKTADIEMNVVTGVHGPNVVQTFILQ